eukprot:3154191-Rhodomonas_salina.1
MLVPHRLPYPIPYVTTAHPVPPYPTSLPLIPYQHTLRHYHSSWWCRTAYSTTIPYVVAP